MNIGYVVSRFPKTTETFIAREALGLTKRGHDLSVLALRRESNQVVQRESAELMAHLAAASDASPLALARAQARWLRRSPTRWARMWIRAIVGNISSIGFLARAIAVSFSAPWVADQARQRNLDHLHAHWGTHSALLAYQVSILTGLPYSVTLHAHDLYIHQVMLGEKLRHADTVVTISNFNRRMIERLYPDVGHKIKVVRCGVDVARIEPRDTSRVAVAGDEAEARPRVSVVAGLREYKGHAYLIEAHQLLHQQGYKIDLDIIGDGPLRSSLEAMAARSEAGQHITFRGAQPTDEALSMVGQSDLFVLPSVIMANGRKDGIPVALMEAMALGVPVVSTWVSGIPELVEHEVTGLLVDERDSVGLAAAIKRLLDDQPLRDQVAAAGRQRIADQFDLGQTVDAMEHVIVGDPVNHIVDDANAANVTPAPAPAPVEVAMVIQNYLPTVGGAERQLNNLNPLFLERGIKPVVYTRSRPGQPAKEVLNGVDVVRVPSKGPAMVQSIMFVVGTLARLLRSRPDVVHAYDTLTPSLIAALYRLLTGTPFLTKLLRSGHLGDLNRLAGQQLGTARLKLLKRSVDRFVAISHDLETELDDWGIEPERQVFIPNGVDTDRFKPPPSLDVAAADTEARWALRSLTFNDWPHAPVVVVVGRVSPEKRVVELAQQWERVVNGHPEAWLYVVGEGPLTTGLAGLNNVRLLGRREDVPDILRWADIYVSASSAEGLSNALLEAMAAGCACVVTDVGGVGDVMTDTVDGHIVAGEGDDRSPTDVVHDIADEVTKLLGDPVGRVHLGRAARQRVNESYSLAATADALTEQYQKLSDQIV